MPLAASMRGCACARVPLVGHPGPARPAPGPAHTLLPRALTAPQSSSNSAACTPSPTPPAAETSRRRRDSRVTPLHDAPGAINGRQPATTNASPPPPPSRGYKGTPASPTLLYEPTQPRAPPPRPCSTAAAATSAHRRTPPWTDLHAVPRPKSWWGTGSPRSSLPFPPRHGRRRAPGPPLGRRRRHAAPPMFSNLGRERRRAFCPKPPTFPLITKKSLPLQPFFQKDPSCFPFLQTNPPTIYN